MGTVTTPVGRGYHGLVDVPGDGVLMVGGFTRPGSGQLFETWAFSETDGWVDLGADDSPFAGEAIDLHRPSGTVVNVLGGAVAAYDRASNAWSPSETQEGPAALFGPRMAYDAESDRFIYFGGWDGATNESFSEETWAYDHGSSSWEQMRLDGSPPGRNFHHMAYDVDSDRVILFSSGTTAETFGDTWAYDYDSDTWAQMAPTESPPPRSYGAMAYDPVSDRMILFGGVDLAEDPMADTWAYDYDSDSWAELKPETSPSARGWHAMALDDQTGRIVMFGGGGSRSHYTNETWLFDPADQTWTEVPAALVVAGSTCILSGPTASAERDLDIEVSNESDDEVGLSWVRLTELDSRRARFTDLADHIAQEAARLARGEGRVGAPDFVEVVAELGLPPGGAGALSAHLERGVYAIVCSRSGVTGESIELLGPLTLHSAP